MKRATFRFYDKAAKRTEEVCLLTYQPYRDDGEVLVETPGGFASWRVPEASLRATGRRLTSDALYRPLSPTRPARPLKHTTRRFGSAVDSNWQSS